MNQVRVEKFEQSPVKVILVDMLALRLVKNISGVAKRVPKSEVRARKLVRAGAKTRVSNLARLYSTGGFVSATKVKVTLQTPQESIFSNHECTTVGVPGSVGDFAISPNSAPMFAELASGVVRVDDSKFFVSGGFIASHEDSTVNISVGECVRLEDIDIDAARKIAAASQAKMTSAGSDEEKAIARIGFDTATNMIKAWESK